MQLAVVRRRWNIYLISHLREAKLTNILSLIKDSRRLLDNLVVIVGLIAFCGPWAFDRIMVPAQYECSFPIVRLYGDFCGVPLSGFRLIYWVGVGTFQSIIAFVRGIGDLSEVIRGMLICILIVMLLLPFPYTLFLSLTRTTAFRTWLMIGVWGIAIILALLVGAANFPELYLAQWGTWLYLVVAVAAFILGVAGLGSDTEG